MKPRRGLLLATMTVGILSGCSDDRGNYDNITVTDINTRIGQSAYFSQMKAGDTKKLQKLYHIDPSVVSDFVLYTAVSNVKADEFAVIKLKHTADVESVMDQIRQRIEAQTVKFQDYRPEEYDLIENHVLKSEGPFIFFAVSKGVDGMESAFDDAGVR
ncbi:uncharacterized protein DUF4358 [Paenibacillus taihuensis]|uniref:Uncharacterized protein DUF4358 n=1 Tax=Paenibacillus taihuensis TaxID=1156355 RepID=A0A3D9Q4G4_9BACL|nr:DUF4358 domain-containing protein [Paenibacillus taihuensis]REE57570.1 uncharacterized protein DUF4358 [Paenibacillus taihuensis]